MDRFGGVYEKRGRARTGQSGRELARDDPGLADASDNDASAALAEQGNRTRGGVVHFAQDCIEPVPGGFYCFSNL